MGIPELLREFAGVVIRERLVAFGEFAAHFAEPLFSAAVKFFSAASMRSFVTGSDIFRWWWCGYSS